MEKYLAMRIHDGKLEYDAVIKKYPNKSPGLDGFTGELYQIYKEKITSYYYYLILLLQSSLCYYFHS